MRLNPDVLWSKRSITPTDPHTVFGLVNVLKTLRQDATLLISIDGLSREVKNITQTIAEKPDGGYTYLVKIESDMRSDVK